MTTQDALDDLQAFLEKAVQEMGMKYQREEIDPPKYVTPYVAQCYWPHKNFIPGGFQTPGILIALDTAEDTGQENTLDVRLVCTTYGGGMYRDTQIPDASGYKDLLSMMERLKTSIITQWALGRGSLRRPLEMGMYDSELSWPYWYGYLRLSLDIPVTEYPMRGDYSNEMEDFLHGLRG